MSKDSFIVWWDAATPEKRAAWTAFDDESWKKLMDTCRAADASCDLAVCVAQVAHAAAKAAAWRARDEEMSAFRQAEGVK